MHIQYDLIYVKNAVKPQTTDLSVIQSTNVSLPIPRRSSLLGGSRKLKRAITERRQQGTIRFTT